MNHEKGEYIRIPKDDEYGQINEVRDNEYVVDGIEGDWNCVLDDSDVVSVSKAEKEELEDKKAKQELQEALDQFEEQYSVELDSTGYEHSAEENGGIREEEYWVKPQDKCSLFHQLDIEVGGWFSYDTRDNGHIYCSLALKINGEEVNKIKAIQGNYNKEEKYWENIEYRSM